MKKTLIACVALIAMVVMAGIAFSAATVTPTGANPVGRIIEITGIDADWIWTTTYPASKGIKVVSIEFWGGAANDVLVIKENSAAGAILFKRKTPDTDYSSIKYFFGSTIHPVIDYSDCTLSSGHKVVITLSD